jgi:hypothetical protein
MKEQIGIHTYIIAANNQDVLISYVGKLNGRIQKAKEQKRGYKLSINTTNDHLIYTLEVF